MRQPKIEYKMRTSFYNRFFLDLIGFWFSEYGCDVLASIIEGAFLSIF